MRPRRSRYGFGTAGSYCFLMMEYVDGMKEDILHRDIKPEKILIDSKSRESHT